MHCLQELNFPQRCDFPSRLTICNKTSFPRPSNTDLSFSTFLDVQTILRLIEYLILSVLSPLCALIGLFTNALVILVVHKIKDLKRDKFSAKNKNKDNMFKHIVAHSVFNVVYSAIILLRLINECSSDSLFCSTLHTARAAQWFRVVVVEFAGNAVKTCCNVSYLGISLSRLVLMQDKSSSCLGCLARLNFKVYTLVLLAFGALLSAFKLFDYSIDEFYYSSFKKRYFPTESYNYFGCLLLRKKHNDSLRCGLIDVAKLASYVVNDVVFFVAVVGLDLVLVGMVSKVVENKKKMVKKLGDEESKKKKKITRMVVVNNVVFVVAHLPELVIFVLVLAYDESLLLLCVYNYECDNLSRMAQFFLFVSIVAQFGINKKFNKVFDESFQLVKRKWLRAGSA